MYKIINGEQVEMIPQEEAELLSCQISLNEVKIAKIKEIEELRKSYIYQPVDYNGSTFINTEISGNNLQVAYNFGTDPQNWLDINGNAISLTKSQIADLIGLMMVKRSSGYFQEANLINQILACSSKEEVNAIDINFI